MSKIRVGVVGASGYSGMDLLKLLVRHPDVQVTMITSGTYAGQLLGDLNPYFTGKLDIAFKKLNYNELKENCDAIFFATPSGIAMEHAPHFYDSSLKLIDISGDFRLSSNDDYLKWYKKKHLSSDSLSQWTYGLSEIFRDSIRETQYLSNPGCYPTSILFALLPFYQLEHPSRPVICDSKSGVSGKGKRVTADSLYVEHNENFLAYKVNNHQHIPEIEKAISLFTGENHQVIFTPHVIPMDRGIFSTIYIDLSESSLDFNKIYKHYQDYYNNSPFIKILAPDHLPQTKHVAYTNECHIALSMDERNTTLKIFSVIDNLMKGAAGSALQNFNIMFNLEETKALM